MSTAAAPSLAKVAFADLEHEIATTRRVLERVPDGKFGWRPHPRSFTLGQLAKHVATLPFWITTTLTTRELDLAPSDDPSRKKADTRDEVLALFDEHVAEMRRAVDAASDEDLFVPWTLKVGGNEIFTQPRMGVVRGMGISHMVHHRSQLGVYLRLLDEPVPSMYGPSADEQPVHG